MQPRTITHVQPRDEHLSRSELIAMHRGQLDEERLTFAGEHLDQCDACWTHYTSLQSELDAPPSMLSTLPAGDTASPHSTTGQAPSAPRLPADLEFVSILGAGGMGQVVLARDQKLGRMVAVKVSKNGGSQALQRFREEAKAAAQLTHDQLCSIYEIREFEGDPMIVMEYVEGATLDQWAEDQSPSPLAAAEMIAALAEALHSAHQQGVIHRDIKPQNIKIRAGDNAPVLLDFGLAKRFAEDRPEMTMEGGVLGTPAFMAPEQATGNIEGHDPRTDVYALGAVLYFLLCQRVPFPGNHLEVLQQLPHNEPPPPSKFQPKLARDIEVICQKAMSKLPETRYQTAQALADDLRRFAAGEAIDARPEPWLNKALRRLKKQRGLFAAVAIAAIALLAMGWVLTSGNAQRRQTSALLDDINRLVHDEQLPSLSGAALEDQLGQIDEALISLRNVDDSLHDARTTEVVDAVAVGVRDSMATNELADHMPSILRRITWIAKRQPESASALREELHARQSQWSTVWQWDASQDNTVPTHHVIKTKHLESDPTDSGVSQVPVASAWASRWEAELHCQGNSELTLLVNSVDSNGYRFVVRQLANHRMRLELYRDQQGLQTVEIQLPPQTESSLTLAKRPKPKKRWLRVVAERRDQSLSLRVGDLPELRFVDHWGYPSQRKGEFAFQLGSGAQVQRLAASVLLTPKVPGPLDEADVAYVDGQLRDAVTLYRESADRVKDPEIQSLARYKAARCLFEQQDYRAALSELAPALEQFDDSKIAILCHFLAWRAHLALNDGAGAADRMDVILASYPAEEFHRLVPSDDRQSLVAMYDAQPISGLNLLYPTDERVAQFQRVLQVQQLLDPQRQLAGMDFRWFLFRAYFARNELDKAIRVGDALALELENRLMPSQFFIEYAWALRYVGRTDDAVRLLRNRHAAQPENGELALELARIAASRQQWGDAEALLNTCIETPKWLTYRVYSDAMLLEGWIALQRGASEAEARKIWQRGRWGRWRKTGPDDSASAQAVPKLTGMEAMHAVLLDVLCDEFTAGQLNEVLAATTLGPTRQLVLPFIDKLQPSAAAIFGKGRSAAAQQQGDADLRTIVLRELPLSDHLRLPMVRVVVDYVLQGAFYEVAGGRKQPTAELARFLDDTIRQSIDAYLKGDSYFRTHCGLSATAWKTGLAAGTIGLNSVGQLPDPLRFPLQFILANRFRQRGQDAVAKRLFETCSSAPDEIAHAAWIREQSKLALESMQQKASDDSK